MVGVILITVEVRQEAGYCLRSRKNNRECTIIWIYCLLSFSFAAEEEVIMLRRMAMEITI